ncbi:MAG: hypothetical protein ACXVB0_21300 [Mucilaginibacter sp.]
MKILLKYQGLTIMWALFIFIMFSVPMGGVGKSPLFFPGFDKLAYCGFFFVLVVFWCNGLIRQQNTMRISYKSAAMFSFFPFCMAALLSFCS